MTRLNWPGWLGWIPRRYTPRMITHLSFNPARRRVTLLTCPTYINVTPITLIHLNVSLVPMIRTFFKPQHNRDSYRHRNSSSTSYWNNQSEEVITVGNTRRSSVKQLSHSFSVSHFHLIFYPGWPLTWKTWKIRNSKVVREKSGKMEKSGEVKSGVFFSSSKYRTPKLVFSAGAVPQTPLGQSLK